MKSKMKKKPQILNSYLTFILILIAIYTQQTNGVSSITLSLDVKTVSQSPTATFNLNTGTDIASGDCIKFVVTNPYSSFSSYYTPFSSVSCTITSGHSLGCALSGSTTMVMTFTSGSTTRTVSGSFTGFNNPYSVRSVTVTVYYYVGCGSSASSQKTSTQTFNSGTITSTTLSTDSDTIGDTNCELTVKFSPGSRLKQTGQILLTVPAYYTDSTGDVDAVLSSSSVVTSSSISISAYTWAPSSRAMTISYTSTSEVTAGSFVSFSVTGFYNPIDSNALSGFYVQTNDYQGNTVDTSTSSFSLGSLSTPASLSSVTLELLKTTTSTSDYSIAQTGRQLKISFSLSLPIESTCYVYILFPDEIKIDVDETMDTYQGTGFLNGGGSGSISASDVVKKSYSNGNYVILPGCTDTSNLGPSQSATVYLSDIVSPAQIKETGYFTIGVYKNTGRTISVASGTGYYISKNSMTGGTISSLSITPSTYVAQASADFVISFKLVNNLYYDSRIEIQMPAQVSSLASSCTVSSKSSNLDGSITCTASGSSFQIDNPFATNSLPSWDYVISSAGSTISFTISSATNPASARSAGSWTVVTYNKISSSYYQVDTGTSTTSYTATSGTLTAAATLTSSNYVTYATSGLYSFQVSLSHYIPASGYVKVTLPSEMSISSSSLVTSSCYLGSSKVTQTCSVSGSTVKMKISSQQSASSTLYLAFNGFRNPRTFKTSSDFTITTTDSDEYTIDSGSGFSITMTTMGSMSSFAVAPSNYTNGALASYTFSFVLSIPASSGDKLSSTTGTFSFKISNVQNPPSTVTSSSFSSIYMKDSSGYSVQQLSSSTSVTVTMTTAANILTYSLYQDNLDAGATATYRITFTPSNAIGSDGSIVVIWPSQITIYSNVSCSVTTTNKKYTDKCTISTAKRTITILDVFSSRLRDLSDYTGSIQIEFSPVTNPKDNRVVSGFQIYTYDDSDQEYQIDVIEDGVLVPNTSCNFPCKTCQGSNRNYCLTCWTDLGYPYLQSGSTQTCKTSCSAGYTSNGNTNKVCVSCDASCATCVDAGASGDKYKCITCASGYNYRYAALQKCMTKCESGYYESSSYVCDLCKSPCSTCQDSASYCTGCYANSLYPYLYSNQCVSSCPPGYASVSTQCLKCSSPCQTCSGSITQCTSCDQTSTQKYQFGYTCYSSCPQGTIANTTSMKCIGCLTGCQKCDSVNQTKCLQCDSGLLLFEGDCVTDCPSGWKINFLGTACTQSTFLDLPLVYFPFVIASLLITLIVIGGFIKDRKSLILSNLLVFIGPIELLCFILQTALCFMFSTWKYAGVAAFVSIIYIIFNVVFVIVFHKKMAMDEEFKYWKDHHPKTQKAIMVLSAIFSFKMLRLHYSHFFGHEVFRAKFTNPGVFQRLLLIFSILHIIVCNSVMIGIDVIGLLNSEWGNQLYINMIESALISLLMIIFNIAELARVNKYIEDDTPFYKFVNSDSVMNVSSQDDNFDKKLREEMLKKIMNQIKGNKDLFLNNKLDELLSQFGPRRCKSMIGLDNDKEEDPRRTQSEPVSPRGEDDYAFDKNALMTDNVYADSKPANPLGKIGKTYHDADSQVLRADFDKILARKGGEFVNFDATESSRRRDKKNRKRGRKNQYYTQIDAEDDEEAENMDNTENLDTDNLDVIREEDEDEEIKKKMQKKKEQEMEEQRRREEEAEIERKKKEQKELEERIHQERLEKERQEQGRLLQEQQKQEEEKRIKQIELEKELQKIEEEKLRKEQEEIDRKMREEQEAKRLEEEIQQNQEMFEVKNAGHGEGTMANQNQIPRVERPASVSQKSDIVSLTPHQDVVMMEDSLMDKFQQQNKGEPDIQVPPDASKRNFNENDILGDFDRDEKGNVIVLQDEYGNFVDKQGRRVNERGYLLDPHTGDIVDNSQNQKMFDKNDIDERGDIPAPFCVEKYNFNPFNIKGEFDYDKQGRPQIQKNKRGELVDKKGRRVNKRGWLIDQNGNIIDRTTRKKFDRKQLTGDGDLPKLFNYNGRRFDINDVCGILDRDFNGQLQFKQNKKGQNVDNFGRLVNEKGYLIDENRNVIDKDGKKIFEHRYLKNGEFPKIFPFTKFNIKNILGNFEMDPLGNPILDKNQKGQLIDRDGRRVNERGYLIDDNGNIIDKNGKPMFGKDILDEEGEIPKVFRTGLLKSDTASSLSRLMSEIEKNQPSEYDNEDRQVQKELQKMQQQNQQNSNTGRRLSGNTSVDSMMEDTPSNYNIANQRFEVNNDKLRPVDQIQEEEDSKYGDYDETSMAKKRRVKKKKRTIGYQDPSDKDLKMAKAYGGQPRGPPKRQLPKGMMMARNINTPGSIMQKDGNNQQKLSRLAGSVSGYQQNQHQMSQGNLEESKRDQFRDLQNQTHVSNFLNETNDPSFMAVPEHHIREQRLKARKMNELKKKKIAKKQQKIGAGNGGDPDFEKMFGKNIDEFLEDSDWDIDSYDNMSNFSKGTSRSAFNDGRIRGLESIYLQRIETSMKKGLRSKNAPPKKAPKFRAMQDRFIDDPQFIHNGEANDLSSSLSKSQSRNQRLQFAESANTTAMKQNQSDANIFNKNMKMPNQTQYRPGPEMSRKNLPTGLP